MPDNNPHPIAEQPNPREMRFHGWKRAAAYTYLFICLFDFVIMAIIFEMSRPTIAELAKSVNTLSGEAQMVALQQLQWIPLTLGGAGMFHIALGAILTGVAIKDKLGK